MNECKRVFQNIQCELLDSEKGLIKITNRAAVKNTNAYNTVLLIKRDGYVVDTKNLPVLNIEAGRDTIISIAAYLPEFKLGSEYHVNISFNLRYDESWAGEGFDIASNQFQIKNAEPVAAILSSDPTLSYQQSLNGITVKGRDFSVFFSTFDGGGLSSYKYNGAEQVFQPLLPHFSRPLTDNDKRGWKPQRKLKQWYTAELKLLNSVVDKTRKGVVVTVDYSLINDSVAVKVIYTVNDAGVIKVDYALNVKPGLPNMPKVGMQMGIEKDYDIIEWFGKGSMENYIDKNYGADEGVYKLPIDQFMENYVVPQENGNRTDVRWMFLANKQKDGLLIVADSLLSMSAWPYTEENIQNAKHTNKLKDVSFITLNIDLIQMGVGGNDSWSDVAAPLEKYQIKAKDYHYSFYVLPYNAKEKKAGETAKEIKF
jgi:beta-galactosidase